MELVVLEQFDFKILEVNDVGLSQLQVKHSFAASS